MMPAPGVHGVLGVGRAEVQHGGAVIGHRVHETHQQFRVEQYHSEDVQQQYHVMERITPHGPSLAHSMSSPPEPVGATADDLPVLDIATEVCASSSH